MTYFSPIVKVPPDTVEDCCVNKALYTLYPLIFSNDT